jgi:hypothetical protein
MDTKGNRMPFIRIIVSKLSKLISFPSFKEKIAAASKIPMTLPDNMFIGQVTKWLTDNPLKAQSILAGALAGVSSQLDFFTQDEQSIVVKGISDYASVNTSADLKLIREKMGDGESGEAYGIDSSELSSSVEAIKVSLARTNRIAALLAIHPSRVHELISLIVLHEPEDDMIFKQFA